MRYGNTRYNFAGYITCYRDPLSGSLHRPAFCSVLFGVTARETISGNENYSKNFMSLHRVRCKSRCSRKRCNTHAIRLYCNVIIARGNMNVAFRNLHESARHSFPDDLNVDSGKVFPMTNVTRCKCGPIRIVFVGERAFQLAISREIAAHYPPHRAFRRPPKFA